MLQSSVRPIVLSSSVAFAGGVAAGVVVVCARLRRHRAVRAAADTARRAWAFAERDVSADLPHLPRGAH